MNCLWRRPRDRGLQVVSRGWGSPSYNHKELLNSANNHMSMEDKPSSRWEHNPPAFVFQPCDTLSRKLSWVPRLLIHRTEIISWYCFKPLRFWSLFLAIEKENRPEVSSWLYSIQFSHKLLLWTYYVSGIAISLGETGYIVSKCFTFSWHIEITQCMFAEWRSGKRHRKPTCIYSCPRGTSDSCPIFLSKANPFRGVHFFFLEFFWLYPGLMHKSFVTIIDGTDGKKYFENELDIISYNCFRSPAV